MASSIPWNTIVIKISVSLGMLSSNIRNSWSVSFFIRICASFTSLEGNVVTLALEMFKFLECNTTNFVDLRTSHLISTVRVEKDAVFERIDWLWKTNLIPRKFSRLFIVYGGQMRGAFRKLCIITNAMPWLKVDAQKSQKNRGFHDFFSANLKTKLHPPQQACDFYTPFYLTAAVNKFYNNNLFIKYLSKFREKCTYFGVVMKNMPTFWWHKLVILKVIYTPQFPKCPLAIKVLQFKNLKKQIVIRF